MKYFEYLPKFEYSELSVTNILVRAKVREFVLNNAAVYYKYKIEDGERPDTLSSKYYGNSNYTWVIFYANNIYDPIFDWPLTNEQFNSYLTNRFGSLQVAHQTPHHYLLDDRYIIDKQTYEDPTTASVQKRMVSVYEHEMNENEAKRQIRVIDKVYVRQIVNEMQQLFE